MTGVFALVLPAAAMAQDEEYVPVYVCCTRDPVEIVVTGSGALTPPAGDAVEQRVLIRDLEPGLGARVENRLRDEAGIVQFRRSDGRSAHPTSQGITLRGLGGNASSRALVMLD
ncbi:MAG TPA: TonB-dependent receptor, partial [Sphingopyxis sp.]|nr:TonB-dependent receptor [Sphingopyxis sp.]